MMRIQLFLLAGVLLILGALNNPSWAQQRKTDLPPVGDPNEYATENEYPPGVPVPPGDSLPSDPSSDLNLPVPDLRVLGGAVAFVENNGQKTRGGGAAGISVAIVIEGGVGRSSLIMLKAAAVGQPLQFSYTTIDAKFRYRVPVDAKGILWAGTGGDINFKWAVDDKLTDSYLKVNAPVGLIGTLQKVGDKCVVKAFLRGSVAVYDNEVQIVSSRKWDANWNNMLKPTIGTEASLRCDSFEIQTDYSHSFSFAKVAGEPTSTLGTDVLTLEISKVWPVKKALRLGFFINGRFGAEHGDPDQSADFSVHDTRYMGEGFTGLQINF